MTFLAAAAAADADGDSDDNASNGAAPTSALTCVTAADVDGQGTRGAEGGGPAVNHQDRQEVHVLLMAVEARPLGPDASCVVCGGQREQMCQWMEVQGAEGKRRGLDMNGFSLDKTKHHCLLDNDCSTIKKEKKKNLRCKNLFFSLELKTAPDGGSREIDSLDHKGLFDIS